MTIPSLEDYLRFFLDAGIPANPAQKYAAAFERNRIQSQMFPHLTKEILRDMGIDIVGDVFAIISHGSNPDNNISALNSNTSVQPFRSKRVTSQRPNKSEVELYRVQKASVRSQVLVSSKKPKSIFNRLDDVVFPDGSKIKSRFQAHDNDFIRSTRKPQNENVGVGKIKKDGVRSSVFSRLGNPTEKSVFNRLG